ncbi:MAG: rhomboid family intramembrane serine protease [Bacteroidota bacterium]
MPILTYLIIGFTCLTSLMAFQNQSLFIKYLFMPYQMRRSGEWYRFFTHAFIHANWPHLIFNMLSMYWLGEITELTFYAMFGKFKGMLFFILLYAGGIVLSSFPDFEKHKNNAYYSAVGASGAICAVVFAFILIYPVQGLMIFPFPFYIPAFAYGILFLTVSSYLAKRGGDNIGHSAHFWGAVFGFVFTLALKFELGAGFVDQVRSYISEHLGM